MLRIDQDIDHMLVTLDAAVFEQSPHLPFDGDQINAVRFGLQDLLEQDGMPPVVTEIVFVAQLAFDSRQQVSGRETMLIPDVVRPLWVGNSVLDAVRGELMPVTTVPAEGWQQYFMKLCQRGVAQLTGASSRLRASRSSR